MDGSRSPEAFAEQLKTLAAANVAGNVELMARLNALVKLAAKSAASQEQPDSTDLLARWLDFNLASYTILTNHTLSTLNDLISAAERSLMGGGALPPVMPGAARIDLQLEGRRGQQVNSPFMVENQYDTPVDVSFEADPLTAEKAPPVPSTAVAFEPPKVTVPPHGRAVASAVVNVSDEFMIGETYRTTVRVLGFEGREIGIALNILPPESTPSEPRPRARRPAKDAGPARRTRSTAAKPVRRPRAPRQRRVRSDDEAT
jgi:hypothetical protein